MEILTNENSKIKVIEPDEEELDMPSNSLLLIYQQPISKNN